MDVFLKAKTNQFNASVNITGSKSESNRILILQALYPNISIENLSNSQDTQMMQKALVSSEKIVNIHHAGTAMRFLTAYFSIQNGKNILLTGSQRMKERPIKILVDALKNLDCDIIYTENEGMPPLEINGTIISKNKINLKANISSQYISALMLIAPKLTKGLEIILEGKITSTPYIKMTLSLLNSLGIKGSFDKNIIKIAPISVIESQKIIIESDWSSASYYYSIIALAKIGSEIRLSSYKKDSLQGDSILQDIYTQLGVKTDFETHSILLKKVSDPTIKMLSLNLVNAPDIAQTIAVSCFGLNLKCHLTGLHTLKIKETDRLNALKIELTKLGADINVTEESLKLNYQKRINSNINITTYNDHRMAMAFAPLCLKTPITILNAEEVNKSYPSFWEDLKTFLL